jgi:dTDP-4-amino-4,6-dideoxygalactose transaminase
MLLAKFSANTINGRLIARLEQRIRDIFPGFTASVGLSGAALLHEAFCREKRKTVVLPGFTCQQLAAAAVKAGKRVVHVDVDRYTMHPNYHHLIRCLSTVKTDDTILLIDHTFGNPYPSVVDLRRKYPQLLIIEDAVRGLGVRFPDRPMGGGVDWVLLSMYKTIRGNGNGAILLTRSDRIAASSPQAVPTLRERMATVKPLRWFYDAVKRYYPEVRPRSRPVPKLQWTPVYGVPSDLCLRRYLAELCVLEQQERIRVEIAQEVAAACSRCENLTLIQPAARHSASGHFVSFVVKTASRDEGLTKLHRHGLFVLRTWDLIPVAFPELSGTYIYGSEESEFLAEHIVHVPIVEFCSVRKIRRLSHVVCEAFECGVRQ